MLPRRALATYLTLLGLSAAVVALALGVGQGSLSDPAVAGTLLELRATRLAAAFLAGAALAVGGVVAQGLFRNPLVSPDVLGTAGGSMLGGQLALLAFAGVPAMRALPLVGPQMVLPLGCLVGAELALLVLLAFARERSSNLGLLLTGFVLSSLFLSIGSFATSVAQESWDLARAVVSFTLGGVGGAGRRQILLAAPLVTAGVTAAWVWGRTLDLLLSGEEEASALGVDVAAARRWLTVWVAVMTGAAVSVGGNVIFVGLIVPHALRPFVGVHHRRLVPAAALAGGVFVVACDIIARMAPTRSEIPLGVVTGIIGAPVFLVLLARNRRELAHG
jgi:iron complex transport system permease protein